MPLCYFWPSLKDYQFNLKYSKIYLSVYVKKKIILLLRSYYNVVNTFKKKKRLFKIKNSVEPFSKLIKYLTTNLYNNSAPTTTLIAEFFEALVQVLLEIPLQKKT